MQYAPTRIHEKSARFHIFAHGYTKNAPRFTLPNKGTPKTRPVLHPNRRRGTFRGVCFCAPTRIHEKPARFHISPSGYVKNAPDFTLPNRDTPKTRPVLGLNRRRGAFRGVCNTPRNGYVKNLASSILPARVPTKNAPAFTFSNKDTPKTRPVLGPNPWRGTFRGVCFCAPTRVRAKFGGFHISSYGYTENAPRFTLPNKDSLKTHPVLDPDPWRRTFRGVCFCAPTRVRAKFGGFHISAHEPTKNAPDFTFPNRDTPKTRPVLDPNPWRRTFSGRMLLRPYTGTCKNCPVSHFRTRIHQKRTRFHLSQ